MTKKTDGGLRSILGVWMPEVQWQPIETWSTGQGVPDVHYIIKGGFTGWIECKQTQANKVVVRPEQIGWAERYMRHGGRSFFFVRQHAKAGPRKSAVDNLFVIDGMGGRRLSDLGLSAFNDATHGLLLRCSGGPAAWDWRAVKAIMAR